MSLGKSPFEAALLIIKDLYTLPTTAKMADLREHMSNPEDKVVAVSEGMVNALAVHYRNALKLGDKAKDVRVEALMLLERAAVMIQGREAIIKDIGVDELLLYLRDPAAEVRGVACVLLAQMAAFLDVRKALLDKRRTVDALVAVMTDPKETDDVACLAAGPLATLTNFDPYLDEKTIKRSIALLNTFAPQAKGRVSLSAKRDHKAIQHVTNLLLLLRNVSASEKEKKTIIETGATASCAAIFTASKSYTQELSRLATSVLVNTANNQAGKKAAVECKGCVKALCELACDAKLIQGLRENAVEALRNITENTKGLHQCTSTLLSKPSDAMRILGPRKMVQMLDPVFESKDPNKTAALLESLDLLMRDRKGLRAVWDIVELVDKLSLSLKKDDDEPGGKIRLLANKCLETLCTKMPEAKEELQRCMEKVPEVEQLLSESVSKIVG
mmetsp:Transcript_4090/g.8166  ORF Transcript_4090/g.8166 Transcript_4090/m.8166 type:complete len:444 (+) Transcript_4090:217-1548(+)|eukprot:CAMPEP_0167823300 /NCGR_PEP_ID=MMETSP0112_2-20121227/8028_1 /TAXON_ID=91324 /ORGANISM="Lotharella globosa, Strain CCCM811" /LENGTH=443 /DNA_ID=CAMNT_0007724869 /DNA_START=164 /DNA_END=1495 /DNA_ORIENTATION=-